jgi:hypothetical protein
MTLVPSSAIALDLRRDGYAIVSGGEALRTVPEPITAKWNALYEVLESIARDVFGTISIHLCEGPKLLDLLDGSTFRLIHYDRVSGLLPERMQPILSDRMDSSFLTVAPKATFAGLEIRELGSLEWKEIETEMADDDVLVFAGDCLARISNNYIPSLLLDLRHRRSVTTSPTFGRLCRVLFEHTA